MEKKLETMIIKGVTSEYQAIERLAIIKGRFVNVNDLINSTKVAVIGEKLRLDLFKDKEAVGEEISISNIKFKVVGVFMAPGGEREESRAYLPLTNVQKVFVGSDKISNLAFTLHKKDTYEEALAESIKFTTEVSQMLKGENTVSPDDLSGIGINSTIENVKQFYDLNLYIRLFFWWVGICTIIAGVFGVSNIMMIIVKERTKEIGIRRALGATPAAIRSQILLEAIFLTIIAGMFGIAMATGVVALINMVLDSMPSEGMMFANPSVDLTVVFIALFILVGSGLLAGYIPAQTAINIKPVDALRTE